MSTEGNFSSVILPYTAVGVAAGVYRRQTGTSGMVQ